MTDLDDLVKFWYEKLASIGHSWTDTDRKAVLRTIKALEELKQLKGE